MDSILEISTSKILDSLSKIGYINTLYENRQLEKLKVARTEISDQFMTSVFEG